MSYSHGGDIYGDNIVKLDFSVNTNSLGMPQEIKDAVIKSADAWEQYPDALCRELKKAAADFYTADGIPFPAEWLVFGNGASDVLYTVISAIRPQKAILLAPGFSEYENALNMYDCKIKWIYLEEKNGFSAENITENLDLLIYEDDCTSYEEDWNKILILGNPNNPTGQALSLKQIKKIAEFCQTTHTWFLIDECFQWFLENRDNSSFISAMTEEYSHVIILNALTKICSMAGLRLGYGIIPNERLRSHLDNFRQPWSVSAPAQAGGVAAFRKLSEQSSGNFLQRSLNYLEIERPWLRAKLDELGFTVYPSETNYLLFRLPDDDANDYKELCLRHGILIRACDNFKGLDRRYYRIAVKNHKGNEILIDTLRCIRNMKL